MVCVLASGSALVDKYDESTFSSNPVLRPITLPDTMLSVGGGLVYHEEHNGEDDWDLVPWVSYGVTDNFTIGTDGLTYRFYNEGGLQLGINGGLRGFAYSSDDDDDDDEWEVAGSVSLFGKKVLNRQLALTFGAEFTKWDNDDDRDDRHEWDYSIGLMYHFAPEWTLNAGYTYRDLSSEFNRDDADVFHIGLRRSFGNDFEMGLFYRYNDFDGGALDGNYQYDYENAAGITATWRF
jgi:hypothetical protein